jgi:predicted PurR-regulated permease PerM
MKQLVRYFTPRTVVFVVMLVLCLAFLAKVADIALMFFAAFVITSTLHPLISKLEKYMPRALAATIVILTMLLVILGILIPLIVLSLEQIALLVQQIPRYIAEIERISHITLFGYSLERFINPEAIKTYLSNFSSGIFRHSISAAQMLASSFTTILAVTIMVFYISIDNAYLEKRYLALFPPKFKKRAGEILHAVQIKVGGFVWAQLISMIFIGIVITLGLSILGNQHAVVLGFVTAALDIIPIIGPTIAFVAILSTIADAGWLHILLTCVMFLGAQWAQNQILRPIVFGKLMNMHPLMIILSLLIGAKFLGFWGLILGPAVAGVVCVLVDELYIKTVNRNYHADLDSDEPSPEPVVQAAPEKSETPAAEEKTE